MGLAGKIDVVGVTALAANELGVFGAAHRLTDAEFGQRQCGFSRSVIHFGVNRAIQAETFR
jgi:hypothetical protein